MTGNRADEVARLDVLAGEWVMDARSPGGQSAFSSAAGDGLQVPSRFEWALDRQFLLRRTEIAVPEAPGSLTIVSADPQVGVYTQHYHDSRGVARVRDDSCRRGVGAHPGATGLHAPGFPAAFRPHLPQGRLT